MSNDRGQEPPTQAGTAFVPQRGAGASLPPFSEALIVCPWCGTKGDFAEEWGDERKPQRHHAGRHFAVWSCMQCGNYVFATWREGSSADQVPVYPPREGDVVVPVAWPEPVARAYTQSVKALRTESWDAAATMARRAIQTASRELGAKPGNLRDEIAELTAKGLLTKSMAEWATEVRQLGNVGAHPDPKEPEVQQGDAEDVVQFAQHFLDFVYTIPAKIEAYRRKRQP